eukprot:scaffold4871_cov260-Pinguiococcus_pyrenoidosus.AAC.3
MGLTDESNALRNSPLGRRSRLSITLAKARSVTELHAAVATASQTRFSLRTEANRACKAS